MKTIKIPRSAKGPRPAFFAGEPGADQLLGMLMAVASEVAVLRERMDTVEQIAAARGISLAADIEAFEPTIADRERREAWRQQYMQRVLQGLADDVAAAAGAAPPQLPPQLPPQAPPGAAVPRA